MTSNAWLPQIEKAKNTSSDYLHEPYGVGNKIQNNFFFLQVTALLYILLVIVYPDNCQFLQEFIAHNTKFFTTENEKIVNLTGDWRL